MYFTEVMDHFIVTRIFTVLFVCGLAAVSAQQSTLAASDQCPPGGVSDAIAMCVKNLDKERIHWNFNRTVSRQLAVICEEYKKAKACLAKLEKTCTNASDQELLSKMTRITNINEPTCDERTRKRQEIAFCYRNYTYETYDCMRRFEEKYGVLVRSKNYKEACRETGIILHCFSTIIGKIRQECSEEAVTEYKKSHVVIALHGVKGIESYCNIPRDQYYLLSSGASTPSFAAASSVLIALLASLAFLMDPFSSIL